VRHVEPAEHGTRRMYLRGCRCDPCKAANAEYMNSYRVAQRGLGEPPPVVTVLPTKVASKSTEATEAAELPAGPGPIERSVLAEVDMLSGREKHPSLVEVAVRLAKGLDDRRLATQHASLSRQLRQTMADLHAASVGRRNRLASVAAMSRATSSAGQVG
jgi:hypothetical protein